jgi:hypothetical protein
VGRQQVISIFLQKYQWILKKSNSASSRSGFATPANLAVVKSLRLIAIGFWSDGGMQEKKAGQPGNLAARLLEWKLMLSSYGR